LSFQHLEGVRPKRKNTLPFVRGLSSSDDGWQRRRHPELTTYSGIRILELPGGGVGQTTARSDASAIIISRPELPRATLLWVCSSPAFPRSSSADRSAALAFPGAGITGRAHDHHLAQAGIREPALQARVHFSRCVHRRDDRWQLRVVAVIK